MEMKYISYNRFGIRYVRVYISFFGLFFELFLFASAYKYIRNNFSFTMTRNKIGEIKIQFPNRNIDVVRIDAESRLRAFRGLLQPFSVRRFQRNRFEEDNHD